MNGNLYSGEEEFADLLTEDYEADEADESDEAAPRMPRFRGPVPVAGRQSAYRPRPQQGYVTQAQLQTALARVDSKINVNSKAVRSLDGRVSGVAAQQSRQAAALHKETATRKKDIEAVKNNLQNTVTLVALLPLLTPTQPTLGPVQGTAPPPGAQLNPPPSAITQILPLLLLTGLGNGGSGGSGGLLGGMDSSMLLVLALALSAGR